jgi:RNA:NAD 2'-phosphotransferase (TPT1/KptA family)
MGQAGHYQVFFTWVELSLGEAHLDKTLFEGCSSLVRPIIRSGIRGSKVRWVHYSEWERRDLIEGSGGEVPLLGF